MGRVVELFVHDGTVVLPSWGLEELQFDQVLCIQGLACAWVHLVPLDEGHNVNKVKNIALVVTIGVLKRLEAESAVVKGQPFVVNLHTMKTSNIFVDKNTLGPLLGRSSCHPCIHQRSISSPEWSAIACPIDAAFDPSSVNPQVFCNNQVLIILRGWNTLNLHSSPLLLV